MGTDAIAALARAAAQSSLGLEKQAGLAKPIGGLLDSAISHLFMRKAPGLAGAAGKRIMSLPRTLGTLGAGAAGADALVGMQGGWGGEGKSHLGGMYDTGGEQWHPWSDPKNWAGNLLAHPLRSLRELTGHGEQGPAYKMNEGPSTEKMVNGKLVRSTEMSPEMAPGFQAQMDKLKRMYEELQRHAAQTGGAGQGLPGFKFPWDTKPQAPASTPGPQPQQVYQPSRYGPPGPIASPDINYNALNRNSVY